MVMLKGKRVVITGASSGIGLALAKLLVAQEAEVIAMCRRKPDEVKAVHIPVDLKDASSIARAFEQVDECDILVNNAGIAYRSPVSEGDLSEWDDMWQVNVRALAYCSHLALSSFPSEGGHIINISSMSGHRVPPSGGFYAATKFAVRALSEALRLELRAKGSSIKVSSVSPGFVDTPLLDTYFRGKEKELEKTKEEITFLTPDEIAAQVVHIMQSPPHVEIGDLSLRSASQKV